MQPVAQKCFLFLSGRRMLACFSRDLRRDPESDIAPAATLHFPIELFQPFLRRTRAERKALRIGKNRSERGKILLRMNPISDIPSVIQHQRKIAADPVKLVAPPVLSEQQFRVQIFTGGMRSLISRKHQVFRMFPAS